MTKRGSAATGALSRVDRWSHLGGFLHFHCEHSYALVRIAPMNRHLGWTIVRAVVVLAVAVPAAPAATIKVTTTADTLSSGAGCSLRAAVIASNTDAAAGGCKAGSGADVIKL